MRLSVMVDFSQRSDKLLRLVNGVSVFEAGLFDFPTPCKDGAAFCLIRYSHSHSLRHLRRSPHTRG